MTADDDRIAYLAGDDAADPAADALDPDTRHDLDDLRALLADESLWAEPDPALEDRIVAAISAEASLPAAMPAAAPLPPPTILARRRRPGRAALWGFLGTAAAVVLVLGTVIALRSSSTTGGTKFAASLAATDLVPGASGEASLTKTNSGWRIELDATGLPRLDDGRFYQAWLKDAAGTLVPIGTFNEGEDVTLWAGVSPVTFTTLTVTEEDADGNQASSGRRVRVGEVHAP